MLILTFHIKVQPYHLWMTFSSQCGFLGIFDGVGVYYAQFIPDVEGQK